jgi:hypothetical protein
MTQTTTADHLRLARLGHVLLDAVPGAALRIGRAGGGHVVVAPVGDARADVLPCQHRAALVRSLRTGLQQTYAHALGLREGGELTTELLAPPGADLGSGVLAREGDDGLRAVVTVTTLCPAHAAAAARTARTVPLPAHRVLSSEPGTADLTLELAHDRDLSVTLLCWRHRPHPAVTGAVDDVARAASAACAVEELLQSAFPV